MSHSPSSITIEVNKTLAKLGDLAPKNVISALSATLAEVAIMSRIPPKELLRIVDETYKLGLPLIQARLEAQLKQLRTQD